MSRKSHVLVILGIVIGTCGFVFAAFVTYQNSRLATNATATAETIRLIDLGQRQPDANRHLRLTEAKVGPKYFYEGTFAEYDCVVVPLLDPASEKDKPKVLAVMFTHRVENMFGYAALSGHTVFEGMDETGVNSLSTEAEQKLAEYYPGHDFSKIRVFEDQATPPSAAGLIISQSLMIAMLVIGVLSLIGWIFMAKWPELQVHLGLAA